MSNKKIIFAGLVFVVFAAVVLSANSASAAFWDWFGAGSDNVAAVANAAKVALKVEKVGKGMVASDDGKINCGKDCSEVYYSGGSVTLNATSAKDFAFDKWTGNACVAFGASPEDDTSGSCLVSLDYNKNKKLTAKAHFKKRSEGDGGTAASIATDTGNTTSTATDGGTAASIATDIGTTSSAYAGKPGVASSYTLKINKSGKGKITDNYNKINCGSDCTENYSTGTVVGLLAIPDNGYIFNKFEPQKECSKQVSYDSDTEGYCETTMKKNKTIMAVFKKIPPGKGSSSSKSEKGSNSTSSFPPQKGSSSSSSKSSLKTT